MARLIAVIRATEGTDHELRDVELAEADSLISAYTEAHDKMLQIEGSWAMHSLDAAIDQGPRGVVWSVGENIEIGQQRFDRFKEDNGSHPIIEGM